ncbi:MAG: hypothetical protein IJC01_00325 [Clostridia bacterium]|nr:hypothetical protein [Clostridia bacterium]
MQKSVKVGNNKAFTGNLLKGYGLPKIGGAIFTKKAKAGPFWTFDGVFFTKKA